MWHARPRSGRCTGRAPQNTRGCSLGTAIAPQSTSTLRGAASTTVCRPAVPAARRHLSHWPLHSMHPLPASAPPPSSSALQELPGWPMPPLGSALSPSPAAPCTRMYSNSQCAPLGAQETAGGRCPHKIIKRERRFGPLPWEFRTARTVSRSTR